MQKNSEPTNTKEEDKDLDRWHRERDAEDLFAQTGIRNSDIAKPLRQP